MKRLTVALTGVLAALIGVAAISLWVTPWPSALLVRFLFDRDGQRTSDALAKHVPPGVGQRLDVSYDPSDPDARYDVFYPAVVEGSGQMLPTIVWVHGGAWVSGSKDQVANYLRILASSGYTVIGVDYGLAPGTTYPTQARQVMTALGEIARQGAAIHVDPGKLVLAGDSAGAQIAAQVATIVGEPSYGDLVGVAASIDRRALKGAVLYCGIYDVDEAAATGALGFFVRQILWAYAGERDPTADPAFATASVARYASAGFPTTFLSSGDADPLTPQSVAFGKALADVGVAVQDLTSPLGPDAGLQHEYQFDLDRPGGRLALERSLTFLGRLFAPG